MNTPLNKDFISLAENKDVDALRSFITSEIMNDPTFKKNACDEYIAYLERKGIDITVPYARTLTETPIPDDSTAWDKGLFFDKTEDLRKNFAYKERIEDIRKIGKKVYADVASRPQVTSEKKRDFANAPKERGSGKKKPSTAVLIGMLVVVMVAVLVIYKLTRH